MRVLGHLITFLSVITALLMILGGHVFTVGTAKIEFGSLDAWASALLVLLLIRYFKCGRQLEIWDLGPWERWLKFLFQSKNSSAFFKIFFLSAVLIFTAHIFKHWSFNTSALDVSYVNQSIHFPFGDPIMKCDPCRGDTRFSEHLGLSLMIIAPITSLVKSEEFIIFLQVGLSFLGLFLLFSTGPLRDNRRLWVYALLIVMAHRAFKHMLIWDFKEDHLGMFFLFLTWVSVFNKRYWAFSVCFVGALISKEVTPFVLPAIAVPLWFERDLEISKRSRVLLCSFVLIASAVWAILALKFLVPHFTLGVEKKAHIASRLGIPGDTTRDVLMNLFFSPTVWWQLLVERVLHVGAVKYLVFLFLPFALFIQKRWWWYVAVAPMAMVNIVSTFETQRSLRFHYETFIFPTLTFALLLALKKQGKILDTIRIKQLTLAFLIALSISSRWPGFYIWKYLPSVRDVRSISFFHTLEGDEVVVTSETLQAQITHIKNQRSFNHFRNHPSEYGEAASSKLIATNREVFLEADRFIINRENPWHLVLESEIIKKGGLQLLESFDERFALWSLERGALVSD